MYVYDENGKLSQKLTIDEFIQIFGLGHSLDMISFLKIDSRPVYAWNRVWSKSLIEVDFDITKIPFQEFDYVDLEFVHEFNFRISRNKNFFIESLANEKIQTKLNYTKSSDKITLESYHSNGILKHRTTTKKGLLHGKCIKWHENGNKKEVIVYQDNKPITKEAYYESGKPKLVENFNEKGNSVSVICWYENGQVEFENDEKGNSFTYTPQGIMTSKSIRIGDINNGGYILISEYYEDGSLKKETKNYYINGLLHGYEKSYYNTGEIRREVDYQNGFENKIVMTYKKNGKVKIK